MNIPKDQNKGLITLDGKEYFPKEYLEPDQRKDITNPAENISDYLRNIPQVNNFERQNDHNSSENSSNVIGRESILESERAFGQSYSENREEGKSLLEEFNERNQPLNMQNPEQVVDNFLQENSKEEEEVLSENDRLPMIPSVKSDNLKSENDLLSKISKMNNQDRQEDNSSISQINNNSVKELDKSLSKFQKLYSKFNVSWNQLNSNSVSKNSSQRIWKPKIDNMFENEPNFQIMEQVYPYREGFSHEIMKKSKENFKIGKKQSTPKAMIENFSKSVQSFVKVNKSRNFKAGPKRWNTPEYKSKMVILAINKYRKN